MNILSIETSCDETGITLMNCSGGIKKPAFKVLAHMLSSQIKTHIPYGGVYPMLAKKEHDKNLPILLRGILLKSKIKSINLEDFSIIKTQQEKKFPINAIAVTYGPGLPPALWSGITFAQKLEKKWGTPIIPINHMEGHIFSVFGKTNGKFIIQKINFPSLSLLISGAHTELVLSNKFRQYQILGKTKDDAVGEAFDKFARMIGLNYPGGPKITKLAKLAMKSVNKQKEFSLPRPMKYTKDFDFSFSGLKTASLYLIKKIGKLDDKIKSDLALEFENAVIDVLIYKLQKAIKLYNPKTIIIAGGVSADELILKNIEKIINKEKFFYPPKDLNGDNALMVGIVGYLEYLKSKGKFPSATKIKAEGKLSIETNI